MANATENLIFQTTPFLKIMGANVDGSQTRYYNGIALQSNPSDLEEFVSLDVDKDGCFVGFNKLEVNQGNELTGRNDEVSVDIEPKLIHDILPGTITIADIGKKVYMTDDQTCTLTWEAGAKFVGIVWFIAGSPVLMTPGFLNLSMLKLSGIERDVSLFSSFEAKTLDVACDYEYVADNDEEVVVVNIHNDLELSATADITFTIKSETVAGVLSADLGTLDIDSATKRGQGYTNALTPTVPLKLKKGEKLHLYSATIATPATSGLITAKAKIAPRIF